VSGRTNEWSVAKWPGVGSSFFLTTHYSLLTSRTSNKFAGPPKKKIQSYEDLLVWQKAMDLVVAIYKIVGKLPLNEQYGLTSQIRRAADRFQNRLLSSKGY
jgi:23S rRNA-intervening sequence protein